MGDSGALLLGFLLATLAIEGLVKTAALATLVLPLLVLAIPIVDTSFVVAKRLKYRQPLYEADRTHLHHRFMNIGFSQKRAVVYMYAWCGILAARRSRPASCRRARTASGISRTRSIAGGIGAPRARGVGLHRLPPRDRQAREPAHPTARGAGAGRRTASA